MAKLQVVLSLKSGNPYGEPKPWQLPLNSAAQGLVVLRLISPSPGLNFHPGFFIPLFNSFFAIILSIHFRASNHSIYSSKQKELY